MGSKAITRPLVAEGLIKPMVTGSELEEQRAQLITSNENVDPESPLPQRSPHKWGQEYSFGCHPQALMTCAGVWINCNKDKELAPSIDHMARTAAAAIGKKRSEVLKAKLRSPGSPGCIAVAVVTMPADTGCGVLPQQPLPLRMNAQRLGPYRPQPGLPRDWAAT